MSKVVICPRLKGNTRKLCEAIKNEAGWELMQVSGEETTDLSAYETVIIASGVYGGYPHKNILRLIRNMEQNHLPKNVHILLTWLGRARSDTTAFQKIQKEFSARGVSIAHDFQSKLGHSFGLLHSGHPDAKDIMSCVKWAKSI